MGASMYHIRVVGELDTTRMKAQLAQFEKNAKVVVGGAGGGKKGAFATVGDSANQASKKVKRLMPP